jgi:hypothetical protein
LALPCCFGADAAAALAYADTTEVAGLAVSLGGGIEAAAVVFDAHDEAIIIQSEAKGDASGLRVLDRVGDGLLRDHAEVMHEMRRQLGYRAGDVELVTVKIAQRVVSQFPQGDDEVGLGVRLGAEIRYEIPRLALDARDEMA